VVGGPRGQTPEPERRISEDARAPWFTVAVRREGYNPELFQSLWQKRIAILTYHKFPQDEWRGEEFTPQRVPLAGSETVTMHLAERGTQSSNRFWLREIRKRRDSGHQTSTLTTNFQAPTATLASLLFARWSQEYFFRYMREHYGLDRPIEYGTEPVPDAIQVVNPEGRKLDSQLRSKTGQRHRLAAQFGAWALSADPTESELQGFQQRQGDLREEIGHLDLEIEKLKQWRKNTPHHIPVKSLPEEDRDKPGPKRRKAEFVMQPVSEDSTVPRILHILFGGGRSSAGEREGNPFGGGCSCETTCRALQE